MVNGKNKLAEVSAAEQVQAADAAGAAAAMGDRAPASGLFDPGLMMLPYLEFSRAMMRAHHNALAMMEANRTLTDALRSVMRRQQDLAFELAETALVDQPVPTAQAEAAAPAASADHPALFDRAAEAVREIGEAVIEAQIIALRTLEAKAQADGSVRLQSLN